MNPIGVNILAHYVHDRDRLMRFLKDSDPAAVVVVLRGNCGIIVLSK